MKDKNKTIYSKQQSKLDSIEIKHKFEFEISNRFFKKRNLELKNHFEEE